MYLIYVMISMIFYIHMYNDIMSNDLLPQIPKLNAYAYYLCKWFTECSGINRI